MFLNGPRRWRRTPEAGWVLDLAQMEHDVANGAALDPLIVLELIRQARSDQAYIKKLTSDLAAQIAQIW
jgi:hypothetical protein